MLDMGTPLWYFHTTEVTLIGALGAHPRVAAEMRDEAVNNRIKIHNNITTTVIKNEVIEVLVKG